MSAATAAGLVKGTTPTTFDPGGVVTREQMAVLVARALQLSATAPLTFTDAGQIGDWARPGVGAAVAAGYLDGFPDGTFKPLAVTTRAQAAKVLDLVLRRGSP